MKIKIYDLIDNNAKYRILTSRKQCRNNTERSIWDTLKSSKHKVVLFGKTIGEKVC